MGTLDAAGWRRVKAVFQEAFERPPAEQAAIVDAACAGDPDLREAVLRLLRAHARAQGALDAAPLLDGTATGPVEERAASAPPPPARIGPYRVVRVLGRGGMGTVYLAERDEPGLRKTVAVKVVRHGMGTDFVLRRFRTERQILAALEHPGIARLYDGGTTDEGLPFFVMEYVAGEDLLAYCDERRLPVEARLSLFVRVCEAVQYAHQALVVHRDLKPSNVLVTAEGQPKLLDFGIAKLLSPQLTGETLEETASLVRLMTPDYASPEQVRGDRVTTASDVYALGVILYELLSGHRPYRAKSGAALDVERAMFAGEVPPPSTALARTEQFERADGSSVTITPADVSARRQAPTAKLRRRLRGDVDNVVLKAMSLEPAARYATAAELAEDISRHLGGFPVRARALRPTERAAKFLRRHRLAAAAAAAVLLSLVTGLGAAVRQARVAEAERRRAEARFQDVRRLANSVIYELHDAIGNLPGATPARRLLVTRALEYLDRLASEARDDRALQRELADAYRRVGDVQGGGLGANLGDTQGALASYLKALAIRRSLAAPPAPEAQDVVGLAVLEFDLGALLRTRGDAPGAEQSFASSVARLEALRARGELPEAHEGRLGGIYQRLAEVEAFQGKRAEALRHAQKAVSEAEAAARARPDGAAARATLAAAYYQLSTAMAAEGRYAEALDSARRSRALAESALRDNPLDAQQTRLLLFALNGEGNCLERLDAPGPARRVYERALAVAEDAWRRDPRDRWSQMGVAVAADALAGALLDRDPAASERHYRRAARLARAAVAEDPNYAFARLQLASAEWGLARALLSAKGRAAAAEACATLDRVHAFWAGLQARGELSPGDREALEELPRWRARCRPA
jgi:non-specific serine/threonine protein kinase/serine/threonine-protein kinase